MARVSHVVLCVFGAVIVFHIRTQTTMDDHAEVALAGVVNGLGELLSDLCGAPDDDGMDLLHSLHLGRFWSSFDAIKQRRESSHLAVAVLALAKSGARASHCILSLV
jgi:hypothetical protein